MVMKKIARAASRSRAGGCVSLALALTFLGAVGGEAIADGTCVPRPSGLVSWWSGDGHPFDLVGAGAGTMVNGATYAAGQVGRALSLDGVNDLVEAAGNVGDVGGSAFSVAFWMRSTGSGSNTFILGKNHADGGLGWDLRLDNNTIQVVGVNGWGFNITSDASATPDAWHHVALSASPTAVDLYIDGVVKGSSPRSTISSTANPFRMGYTSNFGGAAFAGLLDEVGLWNRALAAGEIVAVYAAGGAGVCKPCFAAPPNLVSWWRSEDSATDSAGSNHGTPTNGAAYAAGMVGRALNLDGVDDYVEVPHSASLDFGPTQPMSVNLWAKRTNPASSHMIFAKRPDCGTSVHYQMQWYEPQDCLYFGSTGGFSNGVWTTADRLPLNTWTFVSVSFDGTTATLYMDGSPVASHALAFTPVAVPLRLGGEPSCGGQFFGGLLDEVAIFNRALTAEEIAAVHAAGSAGQCALDLIFADGFE